MELKVAGRRVRCHTGDVALDPARPAVLLLHGAGFDHTAWRFQTRALAHRGFAAVAPDLPGHGHSEGPALPSIPEQAGWVAELLDRLGIGSAVLAGHSMGSLVALETAVASPELTERLVLVATADRMQVHPDLLAAAERRDPLAAQLMVGWMHTGSQRLGGHPQPGSWLAGVSDRLLQRHLHVLATDLAACDAYPAIERAPGVGCPTLVVAGARDKMTPASAGRRLAQAIPQARVEVLSDAGHMALADHPRQVLDLLAGFLPVAAG